MATLFIVDQSLEGIGGHCYDFARCIAEAACRRGLRAVVGANRSFRPDPQFSDSAQVIPNFRCTSYSKFSYLAGLNGVTRQDVDDLWLVRPRHASRKSWRAKLAANWTYRSFHRGRHLHIQRFAADCEKLFRDQVFDEGDHAILAGVSELDLMGLAAYLSNHPRTLQVRWHLLFHFNVFEGRPADYLHQQARALSLRRSFEAALARVPYHRLTFFATTEALVEQYNQLSQARFHTLPYPINRTFWEEDSIPEGRIAAHTATPQPLVLTCAGAIRREKGQRQIVQTLVDDLADDLLATGKLALQVQRPRRRMGFRAKLEIAIPPSIAAIGGAIRLFEHPLPHPSYVDLIKSTDIGLLAYDSRAYFGRRAGILGEYLCAGRPVIVPAASWLAEQIMVHTQTHVAEQLRRWPTCWQGGFRDFSWSRENAPQHGGIVTFDSQRRPFVASFLLRHPADALVFEFRWHAATPPGAFCRVELTQTDAAGQALDRLVDVHDSTQPDAVIRSLVPLVPLVPRATALAIRCTSACDDRSLSLRDLRLTGLNTGGQRLPRSAVGLIAASNELVPAAVRELVRHYPHYRQTARRWSLQFRESHLPDQTLHALLQPFHDSLPRRRAA